MSEHDASVMDRTDASAAAGCQPTTVRSRRWPVALGGFVAALVLIVVAAPQLLKWRPIQSYVAARLPESYEWPRRTDVGLRQVMLQNRDQAIARGDLVAAALVNAGLSHESLLRARAVHDAWMQRRDPRTKLFPQSKSKPYWNYRNTAADFFGFQIHSGLRLRSRSVPLLLQTLEAESKLAPPGELCMPVETDSGERLDADEVERMFSSSEYVKDGLISVYEKFGVDPVGPRMFEVLDALLAHSETPSKFGPIPGEGTEVNGNLLQVCSRLSFSADTPQRRQAYAEMATRIADAVTQQMLPACNFLPVRTFDYASNRPRETHIKLRDHGNEVVPGLAEAYAMALARARDGGADSSEWPARADRWAEPIARMLETMLDKGTNADGLLLSAIDTQTFEILNDMPCDNWGYVLNGLLLFTHSAREHGKLPQERLQAIEARGDRLIDAVTKLYGAPWEGTAMDGYCDTLESALYAAHFRPARADVLLPWLDDQIALLFERQQENGTVSGDYLDGNFMRTAMMYADQKSGGWRVQPFHEDVRVGFARDASGQAVVVVAAGKQPYAGLLRSDSARHRLIMKLPFDWPRINCWPEWFDPERAKLVSSEGLSGEKPSAAEFRRGVALELPPHGMVVLRFDEDGARPDTATIKAAGRVAP